jgi:nucleoside-diphosphate-sugar epimerase
MADEAAKLIVGCGYLGRRVATKWLAQEQRVFATTRSAAKELEFARLGMDPVLCDVLNYHSLSSLPKVGVVLYCIGHDRSTGRPMRDVYVNGLENVLRALPSPRRLIYVSSTSVYGQQQGEEVDEAAATEPVDESGRVVLAAENLVRGRCPSAIVLRFAGIYGPARLLRQQTIERGEPIVGDPERWLNLIHIEDGGMSVLAAEDRGKQGVTYNVADDRPVRRCEFYVALACLLGAPAPSFLVPPPGTLLPNHERANRRIMNRLLRDELQVPLRYPTYETGLPASIGLA